MGAGVREADQAPDFDLPDQAGEPIRLSELRGRWVVLYFYPADDTPGCTAESCSFRDSHEDFVDAGAVVIGVSSDSVSSHRSFADKHKLPFTLLADEGGRVRKRYGVTRTLGLLPGRVTYVIDPEGVVRSVFSSQFRPTKHIAEALETIRSHHGQAPTEV
jgi:thioredoxin-dependent peroxiredoxin